MNILDLTEKYHGKIDALDLELLIAAAIGKPREFVLAHPEYKLTKFQISNFKFQISRRINGEPLAYILGQKEFYGLNFKVNKNTLIPRPETELLVEEVLKSNTKNATIIDVGTGSGNIVISLAKNLKRKNKFLALDMSEKALEVAKKNAGLHKVDKKIKFIKGSLLSPIIKNLQLARRKRIVMVANLPYLSKSIYASAPPSVRKFEPRIALLSGRDGLAHYKKLFAQIKLLITSYKLSRQSGTPPRRWQVTIFMEISPEQKSTLQKLLKRLFPETRISFHKDLSNRWRICQIEL